MKLYLSQKAAPLEGHKFFSELLLTTLLRLGEEVHISQNTSLKQSGAGGIYKSFLAKMRIVNCSLGGHKISAGT